MTGKTPLGFEGRATALPERPASFAERGVAVPFTAPRLLGARFRRPRGEVAELIVPALGGRGVYILDWPSSLALCTPSLHDRQLWERLAGIARPSPAAVRRAAREVAALGLAGRAAQGAALAVLRDQELAGARTRDALLAAAPLDATRLGRIADCLADTGPGPGRLRAHTLGQHLQAMEGLCASLDGWAQAAPPAEDRRAAAVLLGVARLTLAAVHACLAALWLLVGDLPALLARGEAGLVALREAAERPDWLLDGWAAIAALWAATPPAERGATLAEVAAALPVLPLEADRWPGPVTDWDTVLRARRMLPTLPAWQADRLGDLHLRNETLRALAA
jgi:hypothetical protein